MSCKVDDTAIKKCRENYEAFIEVLKEQQETVRKQNEALKLWQIQHAEWTARHKLELAKLDAGRNAQKREQVFWEGQVYDCHNLPKL
jgi:hypothetical protein